MSFYDHRVVYPVYTCDPVLQLFQIMVVLVLHYCGVSIILVCIPAHHMIAIYIITSYKVNSAQDDLLGTYLGSTNLQLDGVECLSNVGAW